MMQRSGARMTVVLMTGVLLFQGGELRAQRPGVPDLRNSAYLGLGYVGNVPDAIAGGAVMVLTPGILQGTGLYADVKFSPSSPARAVEYQPTITVEQAETLYGDQLYLQESAWLSLNLAVVKVLNPEFAVFAGGGYSRENHYRQYFDNTQTRGLEGFYWVREPAASGNRVNALGGVMFRAGRYVVFHSGGQLAPAGVNVGVMLTLPL